MKYLKYIFICVLFVIGFGCLQAKIPGFTVDKNEGCDSIKVMFTLDTPLVAANNIWTWDFGDGTETASNTNPQTHWYNYNTNTSQYSGIFKPKLRVQLNPLKSAHTDTTDTIRIHPKPNANFFVSDTSGVLTYNFLSGKIPDNNIKYKFYWKLNPPPTSLIDTTSKIDTIPNDGVHDLFTHVFSAEAYGANANLMKLKVIDDFGCVDSFEQKFDVKEKLYIPNVFTPNGDGVNDFFTIVTNGKTAYHFQIFTSSGQLVFEQTSRTLSWDGITSSGGKALTGTYFYILEPGPSNSKKPYSGFFMLLR